MRFGILGPTRVWGEDGREVAVGGRRLRALLARLLIDPGRLVSAGTLIDDLYGAEPPRGAANALQSQVSRLRRALPEPSLVEFHPAGYRLAIDPAQVDAHQFGQLAAGGRRALTGGDQPAAARLLAEALALWRGAPLADVDAAPFAPAHAARLGQARLAALEDRIEAELALAEPAALVPELQELVAAHPLRERLVAQLMRALAGSGRPAEALARFEATRQALADHLGADPAPELAAVHRAILRAEPPAVPPERTQPARGLPAQLTSFVGRDDELRRLGKLLGQARLVTLTGPGGAGKTRLAVEAAARQDRETCFVELAPLGAGAEVPAAVATALGLRDAGLRTAAAGRLQLLDRLVAALSDRRLLLMLDNCEQVVSDAAQLADRLLRDCPSLRILATSREPLGLTGEVLCPVGGLAVPPPDPGVAATAPEALAYPAVRLFADRAADVRPDFSLTAGELAPVLRICHTLDGLPLAIELAAARLRSLPVAEVAGRLTDRFALLSRGSRAAEPRHRTLRAVVGWSWELLDGAEQQLARRLTVFAGGATLPAIAQVTGVETGSELLELLTGLVDKSLVEVAGERYRMLETVRAYGAERLAEAGETDDLRRAHASYFLALAWTADRHLRRAEQLEWLALLDAERDNLHAALRAAISAGQRETALDLVAALSSYWWLRGQRAEAAVISGELLAIVGPEPPAGWEEEYALTVLTAALGGAGDPARQRLEPAAMFMHKLARPPRQPTLFLLSALATGPPSDQQLDSVTAAERQRLLDGDPWTEALGPIGLGYVHLFAGRVEQAAPAFAQALAAGRELGERWGMINALAGLAEVADRRGERARSKALIDEALQLAEELGSAADTADLLRLRGDGGVRAGEWVEAEADYQRAVSFAQRAGALDVLSAVRLGLAEVSRLRGELERARRLAEEALAKSPAGWFTADEVRADLLVTLARIAQAEGDHQLATGNFRQALATSTGVASLVTPAAALQGVLQSLLAESESESASDSESASESASEGQSGAARAREAARLVGLAKVLVGTAVTEADGVAGIVATLRSRLGDQAYDAAFAAGAGLSPDEARTHLWSPAAGGQRLVRGR